MKTNQRFQILHISDLHIKDDPQEGFDRRVVLDPLIERMKQDLGKGYQPEIVVVTGDIAFKGVESEYALAKEFFDDLLCALGLNDAQLFIVPGNHDVNRKKYRPRDIPVYDKMQELNLELADEDYRADLLKGMSDYFGFVEESYPHQPPVDGRLVPFVHLHKAICGRRIGLVVPPFGRRENHRCGRIPDPEGHGRVGGTGAR
jgi:DNA repair exonuclease SbcCD nuclease subunit